MQKIKTNALTFSVLFSIASFFFVVVVFEITQWFFFFRSSFSTKTKREGGGGGKKLNTHLFLSFFLISLSSLSPPLAGRAPARVNDGDAHRAARRGRAADERLHPVPGDAEGHLLCV